MIPVSRLRVAEKVNQAWLLAAQQYTRDMAGLDAAARRDYLKHADHWSALKDALKLASYGKCWYCEVLDQRSDGAVDHFRPKGRVQECKHHPGYWWLAFDVSNYRYCCTFCNSGRSRKDTDLQIESKGGKKDHFPLIDETKRATDPLVGSTDDEDPVLLDPLNPLDCSLLTFDMDGVAHAAVDKQSVPIKYDRVERTIAIYHLNDPVLVKYRKQVIWEVSEHLKNADDAHQMVLKGTVRAASLRTAELQQVSDKLSATAAYSKAAKVAVFDKCTQSELARALLNI